MIGIFGAGRNGSTLISRLLDGSPDVWIHPIDLVFLPLWDDLARTGSVTGESLRTATVRALPGLETELEWRDVAPYFTSHFEQAREMFLDRLSDPYAFRADELDELSRTGTVTPAAFLPAMIDAMRRATARNADDARLQLGFKTAETAYVDRYAQLFPGMKFVHIVRHPLSNYASMKRTWTARKRAPFWGRGEDLLWTFLEARWLPHARAIERLRRADPEAHVLIRYEDLCAEPEREVARVCSALGIRPPADPLLQTVLGGEHLKELPPNSSMPDVATPARVHSSMAVEYGYEENLSRREVDLISTLTCEPARSLGYTDMRATNRVSLWMRWLPVDSSERENAQGWKRQSLEIARRRLYLTRRVLFS